MKTVGVVIPIYNVEKYLRECLDSVINQTYKNLQVVLVNDGSTDENSLNIAKEYTLKDKRFILFDKENGGQSSARNVGIEYFSGEYKLKNITTQIKENSLIEFELDGNNPYNIYKVYKSYKAFNNKKDLTNFTYPNIDYIIFLDSDDYWELDCIEECVPKMDGVEVVWFDYGFKHEIDKKYFKNKIAVKDSFLKIYGYKFSKNISKLKWLKSVDNSNSTFACVCGGMIDFSFLSRIKLKFLDYIIHEDHHFGILLFLQANNIYVLLKKLYNYRITTNTTCHYDEKIKSIPNYLQKYYNVFGDIVLAKRYFMLASIFINALEIINFIKQLKDVELAKQIENTFFDFLYMYHFGLFEFDKDPLSVVDKLKQLNIVFKEHELQHPEFYFFIKHGTGVQRIKSSDEYIVGSEVINTFKSKNIFKALFFIYKESKRKHKIDNLSLPYEAYPDYEHVVKIQSYLSFRIGKKILESNVFYIGLLIQLLYVFIKWCREKKHKKGDIKHLKQFSDVSKHHLVFKESDLIDIGLKKAIMKSHFINQCEQDKHWNCSIGYDVPIEVIKIKFNKSIKKDDVIIYMYSSNGVSMVDTELFIYDEGYEHYINIAQTIIASSISIFVKDDLELLDLNIFIRKTLGYVVSSKPDAFGMRLAGIIVGMYLARQIYFKFAFTWKNEIDVDLLNVRQSVKNNEIHYFGNSMEEAEYIFDKKFLNDYLIEAKQVSPSWGHNLGFGKRSLRELRCGKSDETWGWYSTDILPSKWIKGCDEEKSLKDLSQIYHSIPFSCRFNKILDDVNLIFKKLDREFVAIHIRGGEVIFSDTRKIPGWCVTRERYFPYELALELALQEIGKDSFVIVFGQDLKSNAILADFIVNKTNTDKIKCIDDYIENDYTDMERSFFDMNFMSKAEKIYSSKESVFSKMAMMISGKNILVSYHNVFNLKEQYDIIQRNMFKMGLHKLHTAMAYYRLYELSKKLKMNPNNHLSMLQKALELDFENDAYRIYIIDYYLEHGEYEIADKMLQNIFETRKESFLAIFFEKSYKSFDNEYKKYLLLKDSRYTYIDDMKEKVKEWLKIK